MFQRSPAAANWAIREEPAAQEVSRHFVARGSYDTVTITAAYLSMAAAWTEGLDSGTIVRGVGVPQAAMVKCESVFIYMPPSLPTAILSVSVGLLQ